MPAMAMVTDEVKLLCPQGVMSTWQQLLQLSWHSLSATSDLQHVKFVNVYLQKIASRVRKRINTIFLSLIFLKLNVPQHPVISGCYVKAWRHEGWWERLQDWSFPPTQEIIAATCFVERKRAASTDLFKEDFGEIWVMKGVPCLYLMQEEVIHEAVIFEERKQTIEKQIIQDYPIHTNCHLWMDSLPPCACILIKLQRIRWSVSENIVVSLKEWRLRYT